MGNPIMRGCLAALLCVLLSITASQAWAGTTGSIQGYVTDTDGHGMAGVSVSAASPSGHFATTTAANGFYAMNGLPLDTYTLTFFKEGYQLTLIPGVTTVQDQPNRVNTHLATSNIKSLGRITVRGTTSLIQPTVTADTYVVNQQRLSDINGTPQDLNGFQAFSSLPGVTTDNYGYPTIRAGAENDVGYELDGVDNTEIGTGQYLNALTLNGARSVQLSTGGYDVSNGNTNSGVINEVIKRGTYPAQGQATIRINSPVYGHELSFDYGAATPDNRFSYYLSFGGLNDATDYGDRHTILPVELGYTVFSTTNDDVLNLFYHFGQNNRDELQFMTNLSAVTYTFNYLASPPDAPYASHNGNVQASSDPFGACGTSIAPPYPPCTTSLLQSNYITLFPGQAGYAQNTNQADTQTFNSVIDKLNFKRQLSPSSFGEVRLYKTYLNWVDWYAYNVGSFTDSYFNEDATASGAAFDYTNQLSSKNELSVGGDGTYYRTNYWVTYPSFEPFDEPLEDLGCPSAAAGLGTSPAGGCYIAPYNRALNAYFCPPPTYSCSTISSLLPTNAALAPMNTYADDSSFATDPVHKWDVWLKDRWQPNDRLTVTVGVRWDHEVIGMPSNAAQQNTTYYFDDNGNLVTLPGQSIGTNVTQPQQYSPRLAASYEASSHDTFRLSFGQNIEFIPLGALENTYNNVPTSLQTCNIANHCFIPLPGYGVTNHVTNLYQQVVLDLTTNNFAQYTPLLPQTAVNYDFSWEHELGQGIELRITPYYRQGWNYFVGNQPLLFLLPSGTPVFGPVKYENAGVNKNTGVEFALQRNMQYGFSGLIDATYDNTLANYDGDYFPTVNNAALAAGHFYHVTYVAPVTGTANVVYNWRSGLHVAATASYISGYRYGVGKLTYIFGPNGQPIQVDNTDVNSATGVTGAYYLTNSSGQIVASRGTPEGGDPGTLFGPAVTTVNIAIGQTIGRGAHNAEIGIRAENIFGDYNQTTLPVKANPYYGFSGYGNINALGVALPSGVNTNACAPKQTFGCEPFQYNYSSLPYEREQSGPPRLYTFYLSVKY